MNTTRFDDHDLRRLLELEAADVTDARSFAGRIRERPATMRRRPGRRVVSALAAALIVLAVATVQLVRDAGPTTAAGSLYVFDGSQLAPTVIPIADRDYAPNVIGPLLTGGGAFDLDEDARNKVTVVNFWGSWCGPCQTETPQFQTVYEHYRAKGVAFVGIDVKEASRSEPRDFVAQNGITYPIVYDDEGRVAATLGDIPATGVPFTVVLDRQHRVAGVYLQRMPQQALTSVLNTLTAES